MKRKFTLALCMVLLAVLLAQMILVLRMGAGKTHRSNLGKTGIEADSKENLADASAQEKKEPTPSPTPAISIKLDSSYEKYIEELKQKQVSEETANLDQNATINAPESSDSRREGLSELKEQLSEETKDLVSDWSVYVENLSTGEYLNLNDMQVNAGDLSQLFILGTYYQLVEEEKLEATQDLDDQMAKLIKNGDDSIADDLILSLNSGTVETELSDTEKKSSKDKSSSEDRTSDDEKHLKECLALVNSFCESAGYDKTIMQCSVEEAAAAATITPTPTPTPAADLSSTPQPSPTVTPAPVLLNKTSMENCGLFLERLYNKTNISGQASLNMLELLGSRQEKGQIETKLPAKAEVSQISGSQGDTRSSAAIINSPKGDYVLCICASGVNNTSSADQEMADLSKMVYDYFNPEENKETTQKTTEETAEETTRQAEE